MVEVEAEGPTIKRSTETRVDVEEDEVEAEADGEVEVEVEAEGIMREMKVLVSIATEEKVEEICTPLWSA